MDMPSAFPPGTDVNFPSSSVFDCASSVCFFVSSLLASCVFACGFSVCPCAASVFGCAACCASTAAGTKASTPSKIQRTLVFLIAPPVFLRDCEGGNPLDDLG